MTRRLLLLPAVVILTVTSAIAQSVQFGIRLSPEASMQWSGTTLLLSGRTVLAVDTKHGAIHSIWPGPVPGSFAVHTSEGLGVLAGDDVVVLAQPPTNAIVRSARTDTLWIARANETGERREIVEWRGRRAGRLLVTSSAAIADFDVAETGRIAYLAAGEIIITDGTALRRLAAPAGTVRLFLTHDGSELAVVTTASVCRAKAMPWSPLSCASFSTRDLAIVRDAWTGRIETEAKLARQ